MEKKLKLPTENDLEEEREKKKACEVVENWIKSISKEFCSINFNHQMNEVKINFEELPRSGFIDHGSLYDSLCACEEEMKTYRGFEPKPGTVFVHDRDTYVVTSIENTDEGVKYVFVNSYGWSQVDSWGTLSSYIKGLKDNKIEMLWEPKG